MRKISVVFATFVLASLSMGCMKRPPSGEPTPPRATPAPVETPALPAAIQPIADAALSFISVVCPAIQDPLPILRNCVLAPFLVEHRVPTFGQVSDCVLVACDLKPRSTPTMPPSTPTQVPVATATIPASSTPTSAPTSATRWQTRLLCINGFGQCNPITDANGSVIPGNRTTVNCDRTAWYEQPGFDVVPKGQGCDAEPYMPCRPSCTDPGCAAECNKCRNQDSPGTPCGHAPSCDDHIVCYRNFVGCGCDVLGEQKCQQWDAMTPHPGSFLTFTGVDCTDLDGFAFQCTGTPGAQYTICAEPYPNSRTADGRPIVGGTKFCQSGRW